jgi:DNA-binding NtrC family response regulator
MLWNKSQKLNNSKRGLFNFFDINCATFAQDINLLTDIFGNRAKAFTDVVDSSPGILKATSYMYGTLFLDEIGDLSLEAQAMLLRVLQEGELKRVKSNITEKVSVRVITATNKNIAELIKSGLFRYDLYMRIAQARIQLPSLKERMDDFDELAEEFLKRKWNEYGEKGIDSEIKFDENRTINFLISQDQIWTGNIRALQNVINRAYEMAHIEGSNTIDIDHIKRTLQIFDGLANQEIVKQNYETAKNVVKQLQELIQTTNITETKPEDDKEISMGDIKLWLDKAFKRINLNSCTNENLQDLIGYISKLFFVKIIASKLKSSGNYSYIDIAETMGINPRQIYSNNQISTLKIRDLIDDINLP